VYKFVDRSEIIENVIHIRQLHREIRVASGSDQLLFSRRERMSKDLLSNLRRTGDHPMLNMVLEFGKIHSLNADGAHRLFGYHLDAIREYDLLLNGGRTHIVESYVFERDLPVELPSELASSEAFGIDASLDALVRDWQRDVPIRALKHPGWFQPGTFYVHVGTEDSLGSSLPPGAMALVEPIKDKEARQPNPRSIYLIQFRNGYRCSRCVVTRGKLQLLASDRFYRGIEEFSYPGIVRIAGRVRVTAMNLPLREHTVTRSLSRYDGNADLILPNEQIARSQLLAMKHRRFIRAEEESRRVQEVLQTALNFKMSERTKRRYRIETTSSPHVAAMIHMTVEHFARYSDVLRTGGYSLRDRSRYSLDALLRAKHYSDLQTLPRKATLPIPNELWEANRKEFVEWSALLSLKFPQLSHWGDRIIRVAKEPEIRTAEPRLRAGSWMLLEEVSAIPDVGSDARKKGWSRPLYVLRRGIEMVFGYLVRDGNHLALLTNDDAIPAKTVIQHADLPNLRRVCGAVIPV
jgi:hypothetical protein